MKPFLLSLCIKAEPPGWVAAAGRASGGTDEIALSPTAPQGQANSHKALAPSKHNSGVLQKTAPPVPKKL